MGSNSLKITSLDWSVSDVARLEPQICLTIKSGTTLTDLSMDKTKTLWAATFSADHYCCPVSSIGSCEYGSLLASYSLEHMHALAPLLFSTRACLALTCIAR